MSKTTAESTQSASQLYQPQQISSSTAKNKNTLDPEKVKQVIGDKKEAVRFLYYDCDYYVHPSRSSKMAYYKAVWRGDNKVGERNSQLKVLLL